MDTSIADKFLSPEYNKFVELVKKSSGEASLSVQNNKVVYGSVKAVIPTFRNVEDVKSELEHLKVSLLLKVNDLYDKIITVDEPMIYKSKYQSIVSQVQHIDMMIDEIDAYLNTTNEQKVTMAITETHTKLSSNKSNVQQVINSTSGDVHVSKKNIKKLVDLHREGVKMEEQWKEANNVNAINYIIWDRKDDEKETVVASKNDGLVGTSSSKSSKRLSVAKKAVIKKATKKVMLQKLS
jgi:hypothetical protein